MLQSVTVETQAIITERLVPLRPIGATAALLHHKAQTTKGRTLIYVAQTARRARDILAVLGAFGPDFEVAYFPPWDCLPYDGVSPSRAVMGQRMGVLRWLTNPDSRPDILVSTPEALMRKVPPRSIWRGLHREFRVGDRLDPSNIEAHLRAIGYVFDDRVDEPGEAAIRGQVTDLFPAGAAMPCRIEHKNGVVISIRSYDPRTQRTVVDSDMLIVDPASEILGETPTDAAARAGREHRLSTHYKSLESFFDYAEAACAMIEEGVQQRATDFHQAAAEAGSEAPRAGDGKRISAVPADDMFLTIQNWNAAIAARLLAVIDEADAQAGDETHFVPRFAAMDAPWKAFQAFLNDGFPKATIVLAAPNEALLRDWARRARRNLGRTFDRVSSWNEVLAKPGGRSLAMLLPVTEGFVVPGANVVVVTVHDLGGQIAVASSREAASALFPESAAFSLGDVVVHLDHGIGILEGLEEMNLDGASHEVIRMRYADDATLMVPLEEINALWRYGSEESGVNLDKLKGGSWTERRNAVLQGVQATATAMIEQARKHREARTKPIRPDRALFERFCARFPYELSPDQEGAVESVLADLASGFLMDRLVCGDVGFGKTEVALRAAAAVAFSGRQVAVVAPTTVLAQQHARTFMKRFSGFGVEVAQLSRLSKPAEAKRVKAGLADRSIGIVVGTHSLCGKGVSFNNLGLVVIDEEQRFGAKHKAVLRDLADTGHTLTLTATPIPRTLQASFVGLNDFSVIATPPVLRQPIQTVVAPFSDALVRDALLREHQRGGQSFVVCPRIEDIEPMAERLRAIVPDLMLKVAHGELAPTEIDETMLNFTEGEGDLLLATNIIESGLDVPKANTMIIWRPDRFGLSQLHQLRGRVGRGSRRGVAYLLIDIAKPITAETEQRLKTLEAMNRLGAGFEISARDLELRGAGELLGDEQAGHLQLIGLSLYRHFLERALAVADGKELEEDWTPEIDLGITGRIPTDYVPEPETRLNLYAAIKGLRNQAALETLRDEIDDRFGTIPHESEVLLQLAEMRIACCDVGVRRLAAGPKGVAATFRTREDCERARRGSISDNWTWSENKLVYPVPSEGIEPRLEAATTLLSAIDPAP